jgi:hypothetical protein
MYGYMDGLPYDVKPRGDTLRYRKKYTGDVKVPYRQIFEELCPQANRTVIRPEQAAWCVPN